jgi:hypothetical protein
VDTASVGMIPGGRTSRALAARCKPKLMKSLSLQLTRMLFLFQHAERCFCFNAGSLTRPVVVSVSEKGGVPSIYRLRANRQLARPIY